MYVVVAECPRECGWGASFRGLRMFELWVTQQHMASKSDCQARMGFVCFIFLFISYNDVFFWVSCIFGIFWHHINRSNTCRFDRVVIFGFELGTQNPTLSRNCHIWYICLLVFIVYKEFQILLLVIKILLLIKVYAIICNMEGMNKLSNIFGLCNYLPIWP